jgi:hypothetical protein
MQMRFAQWMPARIESLNRALLPADVAGVFETDDIKLMDCQVQRTAGAAL